MKLRFHRARAVYGAVDEGRVSRTERIAPAEPMIDEPDGPRRPSTEVEQARTERVAASLTEARLALEQIARRKGGGQP